MNNEPLVIARCIVSSHSQTRLILGECYGIQSSELYYGMRYARVYEINSEDWATWGAVGQGQGKDKLFRISELGRAYLGEFSCHRFEPIHTKAEMDAEIARIAERQKFTSRPVPGG